MRNNTLGVLSIAISVVTSPLIVIGMSMQMSVMPNLTIYGDVKPSEINKGLLTNRLGLGNLVNRKSIETSERHVVKYETKSGAVSKIP
jgi:hypothetical protein